MKISAIKPVSMSGNQQWFEFVDWTLITLVLMLVSIGLVAVSSASVSYAEVVYSDGWFYTKRFLIYWFMGLSAAMIVALIPVNFWEKYGALFLVVTLVLLMLVLIPGVGKKVNGSQRWLQMGVMNLQVSEVARFCMIVFFASLLARKQSEITASWKGLFKPLFVLAVIVLLLLLEPDFGSSVVMAGTVLAMLFMAGVRLFKFIVLMLFAFALLALLAVISPYRMQRLVTFLDPWADQFNTGYQLTQSLIAFGRGEWFGVGLGNSVQKLFYLPEAHTDFIMAIVAEETGLVGVLVILLMFAVLIGRILKISAAAMSAGETFSGLATFSVAVLFAGQGFINVGVASGLLPTKGLTFPFVSYGGSSLLVCCCLMALVLRVDWEFKRKVAAGVIQPKQTKAKKPKKKVDKKNQTEFEEPSFTEEVHYG